MNEEEQIILRCQQGDRQAMGQLYTAMHDELLSVCRRYVGDGNTAEDLLHDAFLLIFSKIGEIRSPRKARGWMRKVVKNVALLYAEKQDKLPTVSLEQVGESVEQVAQSPLRGEPVGDLPITYDELMNIIDSLPEGYRRVFRLSVLDGLSHQEIAALLNIKPHSSSSQLYRAKTLLRQSLAVMLLSLLLVVGIYHVITRKDKESVAESESVAELDEQESTQWQAAAHGRESRLSDSETRDTANGLPESKQSENIQLAELDKQDSLQRQGSAHGGDSRLPDSETRDTANGLPEHKQSLAELEKQYFPPSAVTSRYHLDLAYSGLPSPDRSTRSTLPYGADGMNGEIDSTAHHRMPMTIGLNLSYQLTERLSLTAGLQHTWLSSEFKTGNTFSFTSREQKLRYLGLRLGADYRLLERRHWHLYGSASAVWSVPLHGSSRTLYIYDGQQIGQEESRLHPKAQWSVGAGMGLQYNLTPTIGFYVEPSLQYNFSNGDGIGTWYTDHRLSPTLPLGVRITIK